MITSKRLHGIGEYYFSQKLREIDELNKQGKDVINLGIGSPDLPPHEDVIKVLQEESAKPNQHSYQSYKGSPVFRNAIANWYQKWYNVNLNPNTEILPLIGSKEGIMHICMTYLNKNDKVLIPNPGYPTYSSAVKLAGGKCIEYHLTQKNNYEPDFQQIESKSLKGVKLMFVNYPHMPTGKLPTKDLFERLIAFAKKNNILIIHDNPYSFILNNSPLSLLSIESAKEHVMELNSLSKSHNMAGWRVGFLCGAEKRINEVLQFKSNMDSGMFLPIQLAAAKALTLEKDWHDSINEVYKKRRLLLFELLKKIGCKYSQDQAGLFVWANIPTQFKNSFDCSDAILNHYNVFITPGSIFGSSGKKFIRVSLCSNEITIQKAIERIKQ
jgi:LL-diaminopimelate aminotransferase